MMQRLLTITREGPVVSGICILGEQLKSWRLLTKGYLIAVQLISGFFTLTRFYRIVHFLL